MIQYKTILFFIIFSVNIFAQGYVIEGRITDEDNFPLSGVNVIVINTTSGTATDLNGYFSLPVNSSGSYEIEVTMIGYKKQRITITIPQQNQISIKLQETIIQSDQVVVTAGKYEQRMDELPVSAAIMTSEMITEKNYLSLDNALRYAPGVTVNLDQVSIRGSSGYSRGAGTRVLVAYDGIPLYTGDTGEIIWEIVPLSEIERVEIIKGASSSLYGSTAIGGVINVITKEMTGNPLTYVKMYYGMYDKPAHDEWNWSNEYRPFNGLTLSHSNSIGKLKFSLSGTRLENQSYRQNDYYKRFIGTLKSSYNFNSTSSISFFINSLNMNRGNFVYWKDSRHALQPPDADVGQRVRSARLFSGLTYKNAFSSSFLLQSRSSYYNTHWKDETSSQNSSTVNLFREELQATISSFQNLLIIGGGEGTYGKVNSDLFSNPSSYSFGPYIQADYNFSFPLLISAGIRFDFSKLDTLKSTSSVSPKIGLNYRLSEKMILRASAGKGFRAPTLAEAFTRTAASGIVIIPNPDIKPETNYTIEFGFNYKFSESLAADAALFHNEYFDMIDPGVIPESGLISFRNLTHAKIQGTEVSLNYNILSPLNLRLNYIYLWARDAERKKALKYRPRHFATAGLDYNIWNLNLGADFRYWSRIEELDTELVELGLVPDGEERVAVYVLDLFAAYNLTSFGVPINVTINAKNIFNYNYIEVIGNLSPIRNVSLGIEMVF